MTEVNYIPTTRSGEPINMAEAAHNLWTVINSIKYKNWKILGELIGEFSVCLTAHVYTKNSDSPHDDVTITHRLVMSMDDFTEEYFEELIFSFICGIEVHEASEFFLRDGKANFHAHHEESKYERFKYRSFIYEAQG